MLSYIICGRRQDGMTRARYFYELGVIHVALMLMAANNQREVFRYVQNYTISGVTDDMLIFPLSDKDWDSYAEHRLNSWDDDPYRTFHSFRARHRHDDSASRVLPQVFGDPAFELMVANREVLFQKEGYRTGGGVKLIHWFKPKQGLSRDDFQRRWRDEYGPALVKAAAGKGLIRKYMQNYQLPLARHLVTSTKFTGGDARQYAGSEEIWFDSVEAMTRFCHDRDIRETILAHATDLVDLESAYAMVVTERVIWDYETLGEMTPKSALLNPDSMESRVYAQGGAGWDVPQPPADRAAAARNAGDD